MFTESINGCPAGTLCTAVELALAPGFALETLASNVGVKGAAAAVPLFISHAAAAKALMQKKLRPLGLDRCRHLSP